MDKWIELEIRLRKKNTIDKDIQEQINKEKERWEKILVRIITIIKYFSKNNLAFHFKKYILSFNIYFLK